MTSQVHDSRKVTNSPDVYQSSPVL